VGVAEVKAAPLALVVRVLLMERIMTRQAATQLLLAAAVVVGVKQAPAAAWEATAKPA
jgi:hypothetical protein